MPLSEFHPLIADWFLSHIGEPTDVQRKAWPAIRSGSDVLIAAPTGSGKTLAAFLSCLDHLFQQALAHELEDRTQVLYVSPLKALSNDVQKNLQRPLAEIGQAALQEGFLMPDLRVLVRTGDTPVLDRQRMLKRPPHILVTTPESLFILITAEKSRAMLRTVHTVIVDEIHAVAPTKRGAHLALSLERLDDLIGTRPQRIGLSATQRPIELVARFLVGNRDPFRVTGEYTSGSVPALDAQDHAPCTIIDIGHRRELDLAVEVPKDELSAVATNAIWADGYDRLADLVRQHRSTLVFVNTRRLAERVAHALEERLADLGPDVVAAHHGSLSRQIRLRAEEQLKAGKTRVVIATASLELGIDVGTVDLVCQIGSPRAIATCLQRIGRAGHWIKAIPKGRLFALTRDDVVECAALVRAIRQGLLDRIEIPDAPLDILAQQIVASVATGPWSEEKLFILCRRAYPYRNLARSEFDQIIHMLAAGIATKRGRGQAYLFHDRINGRLKARRGARLAAITSGGAIPETATYQVVAEPGGTVVGSVDEDFAVESLAGDIMLLGNTSWCIKGIEAGKVRVEDAQGAPPTIPFWRGEAPSRTAELSAAVSELRRDLETRLVEQGVPESGNREGKGSAAGAHSFNTTPVTLQWFKQECGLDVRGAQQIMEYLLAGRVVLGTVPTQETIVAERFFDESGGMQLVIHAPFGGRINRAWGLALRKRFCLTFDFELQAAATDNGIVISLGERHSFPLESVFGYVRSSSVRDILIQALLPSPMFMTRWRWTAGRALALLRFAQGKKVPPHIQRMKAEDLLAAVFPDALACQDNMVGERTRQIPDHPLVRETFKDCLTDAMDLEGLQTILQRIERGTIRCVAVDTPVPSPFSHEILNANPYAFLDDAPLEERRARAVELRRTLPPDLAGAIGALDPSAIELVMQESWPVVRDEDELHDALLTLVWLPEPIPAEWMPYVSDLLTSCRILRLGPPASSLVLSGVTAWVAAENRDRIDRWLAGQDETVLDAIVLGWMESAGPTTVEELAGKLGFAARPVEQAMVRLEQSGQVLRGSFRSSSSNGVRAVEWCHRRLLARIHRLTVGRLRREIEPVTAADFMRFLLRWHHVVPSARLHGESGLAEIIGQLAGFEAPASVWESHLLRVRLARYEPEWLDRLCLSGSVGWGRLSLHDRLLSGLDATTGGRRTRGIVSTSATPISLFPREEGDWLLAAVQGTRDPAGGRPTNGLSEVGRAIMTVLHKEGACFFGDLVRATGALPSEVEQGLWELVAAGLATADGFDNLRALIDPHRRRGEGRARGHRPRHASGRWALLRSMYLGPVTIDGQGLRDRWSGSAGESWLDIQKGVTVIESVARRLLRRYGVVFRDLLIRDSLALPWRDLLVQYRRMEMAGEIRGGRFVTGFVGEQFALPEAVESVRALRKGGDDEGREIKLSACDPLNLTGIILPGPRVPAITTNFVILRNGIVDRVITGGERQRSNKRGTAVPI
ncbi:MAG: DEAD/DEAH box helicase [Nitrospira sp.]|nr:DEAD/DEAH box helicase [Nitrospira sp.]